MYVCIYCCIGGAYIPPARLRMMQAQITDKTRLDIHVQWRRNGGGAPGLAPPINNAILKNM